jgi:hypothetical protein
MKWELIWIFSTFLLLLPLVLAQEAVWPQTALSLIFGELPPLCAWQLSAPDCISCLVYTKLFPLIIFVTMFAWLLSYIIAAARPPPPAMTVGAVTIPGAPFTGLAGYERKLVTVLSIIFSIILLHSISPTTILRQFVLLINFLIFIAILIFLQGIFRVTAAHLILGLIIIAILFPLIWFYVGGMLSPTVEAWAQLCIR